MELLFFFFNIYIFIVKIRWNKLIGALIAIRMKVGGSSDELSICFPSCVPGKEKGRGLGQSALPYCRITSVPGHLENGEMVSWFEAQMWRRVF